MNKTNNISEIRVEEVHDHEDGEHFFRIWGIQAFSAFCWPPRLRQ